MTDTHDPLRSLGRRRAIQLLGGAGLAALAACAGKAGDGASTATTASTAGQQPAGPGGAPSGGSSSGSSADGAIPEETAGPFPGDGSNGPDVLDDDGIVRRDITASYGSSSTVAEGVPLTIQLSVVDAASGDPRAGTAVYVWHCDRDGGYSQYGSGLEDENYLRGVQAAGDDGVVTFTSIFPAAYSGRWPHIHFEVYDSRADATGGGTPIATSQVALPEDACDAVYATDGYEQSVTNMSRTSLASDMVFGDDGAVRQLATMSGSVGGGLTAKLQVPV
jgi:protocatechuate 3,4-dioxygenase beta subunit